MPPRDLLERLQRIGQAHLLHFYDELSAEARAKLIDQIRGLDLDVAEGELVAFLGPNGAGKSTSLRILTTLLAPTTGRATVAGHDIVDDPAAMDATRLVLEGRAPPCVGVVDGLRGAVEPVLIGRAERVAAEVLRVVGGER